jgi:regulator of sigma E protease
MNIWLVVEVILAFTLIIAIHEWGHFIACRLFGVRVERFAIGMGPVLVARKWGDTEYAICAFPIGGYCKPAGGDLSVESAGKMNEKPPEPGEFLYASWWKRVVIFLAGPGMNYVLAFLMMFFILVVGEQIPIEKPQLGFVPPGSLAAQAGLKKDDMLLKINGKDVKNLFTDEDAIYDSLTKDPNLGVALTVQRKKKTFETVLKGDLKKEGTDLGIYSEAPPMVGSVPPATPARQAGLAAGDTILSVNGKTVSDWAELAYNIRNSSTDQIDLQVLRAGKTYPVKLNRVYNGMNKAIGIAAPEPTEFEIKKMGPVEALGTAATRTEEFTTLYLGSLWKLATGKFSIKDSVGGPITIMRVMYQKASQNWIEFLSTVAFISLVLGLMNLLPIPVVDGGQIVLCVIEGVKRGPVSLRWQTLYQNVGFIFIVAVMVLVVSNDVWKLFLEKFHSQIP